MACCSLLACFAGKAAFLPAARPGKDSLQRRQEGPAHMSTGTRADPPEDAPPSPMPRSVLLINQCRQLCTVPTSIPWSCLVSALEGYICTGTNGLHGYLYMCFPFWRPFPTSLSSDVTIPPPETRERGRGSPDTAPTRQVLSLPVLHVMQGTGQCHQTSPPWQEFHLFRFSFGHATT